MKKGYYIFPCGYEKMTREYSGVLKKIEMQCKELSRYYDIEYLSLYEKESISIFGKFSRRLLWKSADRDYREALSKINNPSFVYIRRVTADKKYIEFIRSIRAKYPKCVILVEIYTYPYEKDEYGNLINKLSLFKDRLFRRYYKLYVDRFITFSSDDCIFGVETIKTMNGIDTQSIPMVHRMQSNSNSSKINVIFVGYMQKQHGLERAIVGLANYYNNHDRDTVVNFRFVGDGPELDFYKSLVAKYNLNDYVVFYGKKYGKDLDEIYSSCDMAISTLGFYKINIDLSSSLKSREYLAKGMPVVNGNSTDVFEKFPCDFHIDFPNDSSPINVDDVLEWYKRLLIKYGSPEELNEAIRRYAVQHLDNSVVIKPVIEYIETKTN